MSTDRRHKLRSALGVGAVRALVLPERWVKPVVKSARGGFSRDDNDHDDHNAPQRRSRVKRLIGRGGYLQACPLNALCRKAWRHRRSRLTAASSP
jgi:hypothetical protein